MTDSNPQNSANGLLEAYLGMMMPSLGLLASPAGKPVSDFIGGRLEAAGRGLLGMEPRSSTIPETTQQPVSGQTTTSQTPKSDTTDVDPSINPVVVPPDPAQATTTQTQQVLQGDRSGLLDLLKVITDEKYLKDSARTRADAQIAIDNAAAENALLKTQEKTRRDESVARINAWKEVERSTIQANALMASSLATTAYIAGTPNANVLSALAGPQQQAMRAFQSQSQSVIPAQAVNLNYGSAPQPIRLG